MNKKYNGAKSHWSENIKRLRIVFHMTQSDIARIMNTTQSTISKWENGEIEPCISDLITLSAVFGITVDELLNCRNPRPKT